MKKINKKYCIISNDSGSANQLDCWSLLKKKNINFCVKGPAKKIFNKTLGSYKNLNIKAAINLSKIIICGTGGNDFEKKAMIYAKKANKKLIVWLDHWIFYRRRLIYKNYEIIPHEIWVHDKYAFKIASKIFKCKIRKKIDYYYCHNLKKINLKTKKKKIINLLYLLGRIGDGDYKNYQFQKIEEFAFENFSKLINQFKKKYKITVRLHPSIQKNDFKDFFLNKNFYYSKRKNLFKDLNLSDYVFGANSASMYYALKLNKKVISCIPNFKNFVLPFKNIIKLKNFINRI